MSDAMSFPATVEEFMEQYKIVDCDHVYSNGMEFVPIFRMKQWFEHEANHNDEVSKMEIIRCKDCKYWKEKPLYTYCEKMYRMGILEMLDYATEENDFCSMAERRGEADE